MAHQIQVAADPRNAMSIAAVIGGLQKTLGEAINPRLLVNIDVTSVMIEDKQEPIMMAAGSAERLKQDHKNAAGTHTTAKTRCLSLLACTSAAGSLVCAGIFLKDETFKTITTVEVSKQNRQFTTETYLWLQLDKELHIWVVLIPTTKTSMVDVFTTCIREIIVPRLQQIRAEVVQSDEEMDAVALKMGRPSPHAPAARPRPRILITLDGEHDNLLALQNELVDRPPTDLEDLGIEIVKFAAAASKIQQPCDVAASFRILKQLIQVDQEHTPPYWAKRMEEVILADLGKASRETLLRVFVKLPSVIATAFQRKHVAKGWELAGIHPFNTQKILQRCTTWTQLSDAQAAAILGAMDKLMDQASRDGEVHDATMQAMVGAAINFDDWLAKYTGKQKSTGMPLSMMVPNRRRALWFNNRDVLQRMKDERAKKNAEEAQRAAILGQAFVAPPTPQPRQPKKKKEDKAAKGIKRKGEVETHAAKKIKMKKASGSAIAPIAQRLSNSGRLIKKSWKIQSIN